MEVPYQPELLFKQAHAVLRWVLSLHRKTSSFLHQQTSLFLVLGIPQQPCFLVTCWTAMAAAAMSKDCSLSVATSVRGTSQPLYLLSLSSHFSHHSQFCKGFSYLVIPLCSFFSRLFFFFFLFCCGGRLFKHPTAMQVSRYLPVFALFVLAVSWQSKPAIFSSNTFCRMGTQTFHLTRQLAFTPPWLITPRALIPFSL